MAIGMGCEGGGVDRDPGGCVRTSGWGVKVGGR